LESPLEEVDNEEKLVGKESLHDVPLSFFNESSVDLIEKL
jgi:hypothetical protein|tara:strand:- start:241 stop:360 length:120 start_codon:yes stop_codon:yes gene_type:complete